MIGALMAFGHLNTKCEFAKLQNRVYENMDSSGICTKIGVGEVTLSYKVPIKGYRVYYEYQFFRPYFYEVGYKYRVSYTVFTLKYVL